MSPKEPKLPELSPEAEPSSPRSSSPSPDQWLEPLLSQIARGIDGNTHAVFLIRDLLEKTVRDILQENGRVDRRIADLQVAFNEFLIRVEDLSLAQKIIVGSTVTAAQDASRQLEVRGRAFDKALEDITAPHRLLPPEDEDGVAPRKVRVIAIRITNFIWPEVVRRGPLALVWAFKLLAGSAVLAFLGKLIHALIKQARS